MSDEIKLTEIEVQKIRARPGDLVVFKLPPDTKLSYLQKLSLHLSKVLPHDVRTVIMAGTVEITVIRKDSNEQA